MPWGKLGIEEGSDKQTIKRAYARLLKLNKPDENPDGFQDLHNAYQTALFLTEKSGERRNVTTTGPETFNETSYVYPEIASEEGIQKVARFETLENEVLKLMNEEYYAVDKWAFIENEECLSDIGFFRAFSDFLLETIFENEINITTAPDLINYLNSIFMWSSNIEELEEQYSIYEIIGMFGTDFYSDGFSASKEKTPLFTWLSDAFSAFGQRLRLEKSAEMDVANLFVRVASFAIGIFVLITSTFCFFIISKAIDQKLLEFFSLDPRPHYIIDRYKVFTPINNEIYFQINAHYFVIGAILTIWLQLVKVSNTNRSSSQETMEIIVVTNDMETPDFLVLLIRYILVGVSILLFPIILPINIFLYWKFNRFLHDILTDTKVVRKAKEDFLKY
jgi:hypothetical protein